MENLDLQVLRTLWQWRREAKHACLVTVVRTWGSSPRPVGSVMAICQDGSVIGSVSGGCIEDDLILRYPKMEKSGPPSFIKYGIDADEAHKFGLPCGGTIELLLEHTPDTGLLAQLITQLEQGHLMLRTVNLQNGDVQLNQTHAPAALTVDCSTMSNTFGPEYRMLLIGAGQLTEYLAIMALFSGFAVTVCDPRIEHTRSWSVKGVKLVTDMPDDTVDAFKPDRRTCVIALTHDPKLDDLALLAALQSEAFYVGAIGSRRNSLTRRQRMIQHLDQSPSHVAALRGPVGVYIGSKTPPEIAISIMAEVIAIKNGVLLPSEFDICHAKKKAFVSAESSKEEKQHARQHE
ncbi:XdhC family protein [Pollutimonas bauzanensis]|uniref:XdhC family protein n=1 Tax=Pollutimonas bauzanensis TaxID=658167 RepID=UPI00333F607C